MIQVSNVTSGSSCASNVVDIPLREVYKSIEEHGYNRTDEEPNDEDYNNVDNDHGKKKGNEGGDNGDSNDHGEGRASGTMVGGNTNAASIGIGNGGSSNACQEHFDKGINP
jgi:hypothetical protein